MNQKDKRQLENQLLTMGLPKLNDPALIQVMADVINAYPIPSERIDFFCDMLNECDAGHRGQMYNALKPYLHFDVPSFPECETRITQKAERMVGRTWQQKAKKAEELPETILSLECFGCKDSKEYRGLTTADAMLQAKKAGWGRGPVPGHEYCPECRLKAFLPNSLGPIYTRRHNALAAR